MLKVVKFGGSSLADAAQFRKVAEIIKADDARRYVVPSAPGISAEYNFKVTDMLYACHDAFSKGENGGELFEKIKDRYDGIIKGLGLGLSLENEYKTIVDNIKAGAGRDYAASRGEYLNGILLSAYLGYEFVDAAQVVVFSKNGKYDDEATTAAISARLKGCFKAVIPGFYGALPDGRIKTFSRGGSDITGSIVAKAAKADIYENWTDVSGFLMADPRIVKNPEGIDVITYRELRELSYMGATVLHEDSIFPVRSVGIPINIKNTNDPDAPGTLIVAQAPSRTDGRTVTGIAGKKGFSSITIEKDMMNNELGFGRKVLAVLEENGVSFEHLPSGIDTMSISVKTSEIEGKQERILDALRQLATPGHVELENGLAEIAVVGRGMYKTKGVAASIFMALAQAGINIRMIDQGSSELNIIIGVEAKDFEDAVRAIYNKVTEK